jgi:hypothetical protein
MKQVVIPKKDWDAIVRFFKAETKVAKDSYRRPGEPESWKEEFKRMDPDGFPIYEAAEKAIGRVKA